VQYLETGTLEEELFLKMTTDKLPENNLRLVFAAIMVLLRAALRQPTLKSEVTTPFSLVLCAYKTSICTYRPL